MIVKDSFSVSNGNAERVYIKWDPKFEIGIPVIDEQHKTLVALCNNLYQELMLSQNNSQEEYKTSLTKALHECVEYVKTHFRNEEILMQAAGYAYYEEHKIRHEEFVKQVLETVKNFDKASFTTGIQFVKFLYDWILSHIAHEDRLYVKTVLDFYKKSKQK